MFTDADSLARTPAHALALDCLAAGIDAAHPRAVTRGAVAVDGTALRIGDETYDLDAYDAVIALGGGNAASQVARELEAILGDRLDGGGVVTDDPVETERIAVLPGDHPVPSDRGVESTREVLQRARRADERTLVIGVITGGGSALLAAPAGTLTADALRGTTDALLKSGATIHEINAVRKHLSALKGGRLAAAAAPATVACLVLSDVVGNDLDTIASGPFVPDRTTYADAIAVLDRYDVTVPDSIRSRLEAGVAGERDETPKPGDRVFDRVSTHVIADGFTALRAAADLAGDAGYDPLILSSRIRGEAREAAKTHVAVAEEMRATGNPIDPPAVVLSGGETTVTIRGDGDGGPNQEFALAAAAEFAGATDAAGVVVGSVDTDGVDGATDAAGALVDAETVDAAAAHAALADNDAYPLLDDAGAILRSGPSGTNVNDLRVVVVPPAGD
ncbi:glycerate kinase type-2 family protein [Haloferacaceae archaeon DSL9]